nr:AraC family transcriptional regulator [Luteibacter rhizovicinus]
MAFREGIDVAYVRPEARLSELQARRIAAFMEANLGAQVPLHELAGLVHLSVGHFCRAFKGSFGERPRAYLMRRRVAYAMRLMLSTDQPLSEIALACGMADQPHFSNVFRRMTGETPSRWRVDNRPPALRVLTSQASRT